MKPEKTKQFEKWWNEHKPWHPHELPDDPFLREWCESAFYGGWEAMRSSQFHPRSANSLREKLGFKKTNDELEEKILANNIEDIESDGRK